jgi:hypothetical protein
MILRRLSQHLREQNWTAIAIEFLLLVVGVFLGIQVANWSEDRVDRTSERDYLERLQREIVEILPQAKATQASLAEQAARIEALRAYLATGENADALDDQHCVAAGRSHIYATTIFYPPTIRELISTGRILLIREPRVRSAILSFDQAHTDLSQLRTDIQIDRRVLARHYPELIDSGLSSDWSGAVCDFGRMRHNQAFLNDFTDNMRRYQAYAAELGQRQVETFEALDAALTHVMPRLSPQALAPTTEASRPREAEGDR